MNYVENDYGKQVPAVGAPGSLARVKVTCPLAIDQAAYAVCRMNLEGIAVDSFFVAIREKVVQLKMDQRVVVDREEDSRIKRSLLARQILMDKDR